MNYVITVIAPDGTVLFGGKTSDPDELDAVAREARKLRPIAKIFLRSPFGQVVEFDPVE